MPIFKHNLPWEISPKKREREAQAKEFEVNHCFFVHETERLLFVKDSREGESPSVIERKGPVSGKIGECEPFYVHSKREMDLFLARRKCKMLKHILLVISWKKRGSQAKTFEVTFTTFACVLVQR